MAPRSCSLLWRGKGLARLLPMTSALFALVLLLAVDPQAASAQSPTTCPAGTGAAPRRGRTAGTGRATRAGRGSNSASPANSPCVPCAVNTYNPSERPLAQAKCVRCPQGTTTRGQVSSPTCFTNAGFVYNAQRRVVKCPVNNYCLGGDIFSPSQAAVRCPEGTTTTGTNANDELGDCVVSSGFFFDETTNSVAPCPSGTFCSGGRVNNNGREPKLCPPGFATVNAGSSSESECVKINYCTPNPCVNSGRCVEFTASYTCVCDAGFSGVNCETNVDDCASQPCGGNGNCVDKVNGYDCQCFPGWTGAKCDLNLNECTPSSCKHGGTCVDGVNGFTCDCPADKTTGQFCETIRAGFFWDTRESKVAGCRGELGMNMGGT
jgi:hypothetical protein